jgi:hypothetical protein
MTEVTEDQVEILNNLKGISSRTDVLIIYDIFY